MLFTILIIFLFVVVMMRWFLTIVGAVIGFITGGFFFGLGVGVVIYFLVSLIRLIGVTKIVTDAIDENSNKR